MKVQREEKIYEFLSKAEMKQPEPSRVSPNVPDKDINPFGQSGILINNPTLCTKRDNLTAFIFVPMSVSDFEGRSYLRKRWLSPYLFKEPHVTSAFMVGLSQYEDLQDKLEIEAKSHGDIIQGDFIDTYKNQTIKNIAALQWIHKYCRNAFYIIKTDADVFIHIVQIMDYLERHPIGPNTFSSRQIRGRVINGVYRPPYCWGPFYIHRGDFIEMYLYTTMRTPFTNWYQDVFMTGFVRVAMKNVSITPTPVAQWRAKHVPAHKQYLDCSRDINSYVIHRNDHKFQDDFHKAWAAALQRLPTHLKLKVNETFLEEARKIFPGCEQ